MNQQKKKRKKNVRELLRAIMKRMNVAREGLGKKRVKVRETHGS